MKLDDMLRIILHLVKDEETKKQAERVMVSPLTMLGLAGRSEGCWRASPELIRLAYQSEKFLSNNCLALDVLSMTDKDLDDLEEDDDALKKKRIIPLRKKVTPKVSASFSKKKAK
jgi:hypothetical protein